MAIYSANRAANAVSHVEKSVSGNMKLSPYEILEFVSSGMSFDEIREDYPELTTHDIKASLALLADKEF